VSNCSIWTAPRHHTTGPRYVTAAEPSSGAKEETQRNGGRKADGWRDKQINKQEQKVEILTSSIFWDVTLRRNMSPPSSGLKCKTSKKIAWRVNTRATLAKMSVVSLSPSRQMLVHYLDLFQIFSRVELSTSRIKVYRVTTTPTRRTVSLRLLSRQCLFSNFRKNLWTFGLILLATMSLGELKRIIATQRADMNAICEQVPSMKCTTMAWNRVYKRRNTQWI
jgi:hypothetical protein